MDPATRHKVIEKMTTERDLRNQMAWARKEAIEEGLAEGRERGMAEGRAEGRAEGITQARYEMAEKLIDKGMGIADIADVTGISPEEIRNLTL